MFKDRPKVGVGIIMQNAQNEILIGKRKGSHAPLFSIPGGHLENGETFEEAAV
jgi:8-oxo-dGTP diphosphatase